LLKKSSHVNYGKNKKILTYRELSTRCV